MRYITSVTISSRYNFRLSITIKRNCRLLDCMGYEIHITNLALTYTKLLVAYGYTFETF